MGAPTLRSVKIEYPVWERFAAIARARGVATTLLVVQSVVHFVSCPHAHQDVK